MTPGQATTAARGGWVTSSRLLLIWLIQQTPMGSVKGCPDRHFPRPCGSFKANLPPRKPANNTSRSAAGPRANGKYHETEESSRVGGATAENCFFYLQEEK